MAISAKSRARINERKAVLARQRSRGMVKVRWRLEADKAVKRLKGLSQELVDGVLNDATKATNHYLFQEFVLNAPWESGHLVNVSYERKRKRPRRRTRVGWEVIIPHTRFQDHYYPLPVEFGWDDLPEGAPFLRRLIPESRHELLSVFKNRLVNGINRLQER